MSFPFILTLENGEEKNTYSSRPGVVLGTRATTRDGREFRFCLNGGTALEAHRVLQAYAYPADLAGNTTVFSSTATVSGVTSVQLAPTTVLTSGVLAGGYLIVETSGTARAMYKIKSQPAAGTTAANLEIFLDDNDKLLVPLTTVYRLAVVRNPYSSVIVAPTALTGMVVGVTPIAVAVNRYFWAQTKGPAALEYNAGVVAVLDGNAIVPDSGIAGAFGGTPGSPVGTSVLTTVLHSGFPGLGLPVIGWVDRISADALSAFVNLNIP